MHWTATTAAGLAALFLMLTGGPAAAESAGGHWAAAWAAAPQPRSGGGPLPLTVENQTLRQAVRLTLGGERLQIRLSNEFGKTPLRIGRAVISGGGATRHVTFGGHPGATIPPGAPLLSDPVDLPMPRMGEIVVNLYLPDKAYLSTVHGVGLHPTLVSAPGDYTLHPAFPVATRANERAIITGVSVWSHERTQVIVAMGASVVDGYRSTPGAYAAWPDVLASRLAGRPGIPTGVLNLGLAGNMLVGQGTGPPGLSRFDRDVLGQPGLTHVILLEGRNDLNALPGARTPPAQVGQGSDAEALYAAYVQIAERAHQRGIKVIVGPVTPDGTATWDARKEAERRKLNALLRASRAFDGYIEVDAPLQNPVGPGLKPLYDSGDHLHPSDAGYRAMAEAIDLDLFEPREGR